MEQRIPSFNAFVFEQRLYEANLVKTTDLQEFEKQLPLVFNIYEYMITWYDYLAAFRTSRNISEMISGFAKNFDFSKVVLSKGQYVKIEKERANQGYGDARLKTKDYQETWDTMFTNNIEQLINVTIKTIGVDKFFLKVAKELESKVNKLDLAKMILARAYRDANSSYDRNLTMDKYYNKIENIWKNGEEVYYAVGRGSLRRISKASALHTYLADNLKKYGKG